MGNLRTCDNCGGIIVVNLHMMSKTSVTLAELKGIQTPESDLRSALQSERDIRDRTKNYDLCDRCNNVIEKVLCLRLKEFLDLEKEINKISLFKIRDMNKEPEKEKGMDRDKHLQDLAGELIKKISNIADVENLPNIYFVGKAGARKSYSSSFLIEKYGYQIAKFAYPIYMIAEKYFNMTEKDRKLLQILGTEAGRDTIRQSIWIDRFEEDMLIVRKTAELLNKQVPKFVMDDCRFPNEHEVLKRLGFVGIYIDVPEETRKGRLIGRDGTAQEKTLNHKSETLIDTFKDDLIKLDGSGDLEASYLKLNELLQRWVRK